MKKKKSITFRVDEFEKPIYEATASHLGLSLSQLIRKSLELYGALGFDIHKSLEGLSAEMKLPVGEIVEHYIQKRLAVDAAWIQTFGTRPPGAGREFRFGDDGRLVSGNKLFDELMVHYVEVFNGLKDKLTKSKKTGQTVEINREEMILLQACL